VKTSSITTWRGLSITARTPHGYRTFRVSRIENARLLEQPVERPADFDLAAFWRASTEELRRGWAQYEVTLRMEARAAAALERWRAAAPVADADTEPGWVTRRFQFDDEEQARFVALGHGPRAEVVEPASLSERVAADLAAAAARAAR
jgi:predicted DNA-binding transcriptional regulator YafY